ncbi:DUF2273 domain-containing protein [Lactobacillus sp. ESL0791]|uniref:DUF2273 domain-containing protein n=1 Tax=Lactobacillus sp. ESL0791 TaxID=2983234 RepID=UPI0023F69D3D|nr:DUF2273 domain-containing protein [Lactobacillus sp. ESL0791]MDF7639852.1 DUF2273 domain-containing protein [Lactobacillus sp. ESL0791]
MKEFIKQHLPILCGGAIGLLLAFCFLGLGFFKTIFVVVMLVLGGLFGYFWPVLKKLRDK